MTLPSVIDRTASRAIASRAGVPSAVTARSTTSRAASAAIFDTVARKVATGVDAPAYAVGVHAWNGTSDSLNPIPASTSTVDSETRAVETDAYATPPNPP